MTFSDDILRRIGALSGLMAGFGLMYAIGQVDLVRAFIFGVSGCLIGSSAAQRYAKTRHQAATGRRSTDDDQWPDDSQRPDDNQRPDDDRTGESPS